MEKNDGKFVIILSIKHSYHFIKLNFQQNVFIKLGEQNGIFWR